MDRVTFLLEKTGERIACLLNPESLQIARRAGLRPRRSQSGGLIGKGGSDDPLLFTGGGSTELQLDLLFDVSLAGGTVQTDNVRELTRPLWQLAEGSATEDGSGGAAIVRFVWGRVWNIPGVIADVAERFEQFTSEGAPRRSWMRMRFVRVDVPDEPARPSLSPEEAAEWMARSESSDDTNAEWNVHEVRGGGPTEDSAESGPVGGTGDKLYDIAYDAGFDPACWRLLADLNRIADPLHLEPGLQLRVPSPDALGKA